MTDTEEKKQRVPRMSREDRRKMIVQAVLPLIAEHGPSVTTAQIARTAGIGEGTIFRAFEDKDELVQACVEAALRPDDVLELIGEIPLDQPLAARLAEAADAMSAHLDRMGAVAGAMHAHGEPRERRHRSGFKDKRRGSFDGMRDALAELFAPERERLRMTPNQLAGLFLSLLLSRARGRQEKVPMDQLVDLFLHGAVVRG